MTDDQNTDNSDASDDTRDDSLTYDSYLVHLAKALLEPPEAPRDNWELCKKMAKLIETRSRSIFESHQSTEVQQQATEVAQQSMEEVRDELEAGSGNQ